MFTKGYFYTKDQFCKNITNRMSVILVGIIKSKVLIFSYFDVFFIKNLTLTELLDLALNSLRAKVKQESYKILSTSYVQTLS